MIDDTNVVGVEWARALGTFLFLFCGVQMYSESWWSQSNLKPKLVKKSAFLTNNGLGSAVFL